MFCADQLTLDAPKRTSAGYMAVRAKVARTGLYDYAGVEVDPHNEHGLRDKQVVKVYRPGDQVFDKKSVASFIGKPITNDHPSVPVTADNWKQHASGTIMNALRDGEHLSFDLLLTDKAAIDAVDSGKRELSNGYATDLKFEPGETPDGQTYDAIQTSITGNHIALVDAGRAGPECRIGDKFAACDSNPARVAELQDKEKPMTKIVLDGLQVDLSDADAVAAAFDKLQKQATDAEAALTTATDSVSTLTGEKTALEAKLKDAQDAANPAALDALVADRAALVAAAKAVKTDIVTDGKTAADIRKEVVTAKLGDAAASLDDGAVTGAFAVLTVDAEKPVTQNISPAAVVADAAAKETAALTSANDHNAWRKQA